ncbi:MAG: hypothetical protein ACLS6G_03950 [Christensenellales bacterium]
MNRIAKSIVTLAATAALALTSAAALAPPLQLGVPDDGTNLSAASAAGSRRLHRG